MAQLTSPVRYFGASKVREEQDFARYEKSADFAYGFCSMFLEFKNFFG